MDGVPGAGTGWMKLVDIPVLLSRVQLINFHAICGASGRIFYEGLRREVFRFSQPVPMYT